MRRSFYAVFATIALALAACAPQQTGSTIPSSQLGRAAAVSYGTVIGMRQVQVARRPSGFGALAGAAAGGLGGSFIGGDWRSNALAGLGGALAGGLAGNALEGGTGGGIATEFIVREDGRGDIAITQTNEEALQVGERVYITRSDRVRLARAAGGAAAVPPAGQPPAGMPMASPSGIGPAK